VAVGPASVTACTADAPSAAAPLFAALALRPALAGITAAAAAVVLIPCVLANPSKPLVVDPPAKTVLARDRLSQMTVVRPEMAPVIARVDQTLGPGAPLAFSGGEDSWDYPFFGAHRERRVVRFANPADVTAAALRRVGVRGVLFANVPPPRWFHHTQEIAPGYRFERIG
jgi:hypothetical protein